MVSLMRKIIALLSVICLVLCCGCSMHYGETTVDKDNVTFYPSRVNKVCFAGRYNWDGSSDNLTINIPDKVDGYRVTKIGGYTGRGMPTPFCIDFSSIGSHTLDVPENAQITVYNFTLNIGKNVNEMQNIRVNDYFKINGTEQYAKIVFTINCHKDNKHFYSLDGKLYNKKDNTLVTEFEYFNEKLT